LKVKTFRGEMKEIMGKFLHNKIDFSIKLNDGDARYASDNGYQIYGVGTDYITVNDAETGNKINIPFKSILYVEEIHVEEPEK
jgi:hypothetical protein